MTIEDITLDTNVLLHSCNVGAPWYMEAYKLTSTLLDSAVNLAMDTGFSVDPAKNRSLIGGEYLSKLVPGSLPWQVVVELAKRGRVKMYECRIDAQSAKKLNRLVGNKRDRTFVRVCTNSEGKVLVSHDFADFPKKVRKAIGEAFGVRMTDAEGAVTFL